jgi:hypothetical protein
MNIFCSGSCRLLTTIHNGNDKIIPIHSLFYNFSGINFLGKLHNTKQHIQFIKFIKDEIIIPDDILPKFLTSYNSNTCGFTCEPLSLNIMKKKNIYDRFDSCEWYIFEISSLKLYKNNHFHVQCELTNDYTVVLQTEEELVEDLITIRNLIPFNKKLLFQVHFRPNIIYNDTNKTVKNREIIFNVIKQFCENNQNTYFYDPSDVIKKNPSLFVFDHEKHFTEIGHTESFKYIYNNYINFYV